MASKFVEVKLSSGHIFFLNQKQEMIKLEEFMSKGKLS